MQHQIKSISISLENFQPLNLIFQKSELKTQAREALKTDDQHTLLQTLFSPQVNLDSQPNLINRKASHSFDKVTLFLLTSTCVAERNLKKLCMSSQVCLSKLMRQFEGLIKCLIEYHL